MRIRGYIVDDDSYDAVPSASVELWAGNIMLTGVAADAYGTFSLETSGNPDRITITSVGYKPASFPMSGVSDNDVYPIVKDIKEGDNVIVSASLKKNGLLWVGLGFLVLLALNDKKR